MLSIIIPTLNEEKYLPLLLDSIKKQSFQEDYEIIVADAGSKDKTVEIAVNSGCRVIAGGLPPKGRNEGARAARGNSLLFLDADVILPEGFLSKLLEKFEEKDLDMSSTALEVISQKKIYKLGSALFNFYFKLNQRFFPCAGGFCLLVKKEMHQRLKGFDERIKVGEDFDYVRRAKKISNFYFFDSLKFLISPRRFEKEGRIRTFIKYLIIEFYQIVFGSVKSDIFKYRFGHYSKGRKKRV